MPLKHIILLKFSILKVEISDSALTIIVQCYISFNNKIIDLDSSEAFPFTFNASK